MMKLATLSALSVLLLANSLAAAEPSRPNVLIVMTDDQGYGELSCHGNPVIRTPHLDELHSQSVRFTDFHVAPMCTPTRGQLMTGVSALRNGAMNVSSGRTLLRREYPTLPELLKRQGYHTGMFGKWHLGDNYPFRPQDRGFDECLWFPSSHIGSVPDFWMNDYFDDTYHHGDEREKCAGYTTDVFFREAMQWMKSQHDAGEPFFCYLPTAAPHSPHYVPEKYRVAVRARLTKVLPQLPSLKPQEQESLVRFLAMIKNIDENLGRLEEFLTTEKLRENTILIFLTDNGSTMGPKYFNAGMTGSKTTLWEGGHRVPLFVRWPAGKLGPPRDVTTLAQVQDVLPTVLDLCGVNEKPQIDGTSLAPLLKQEAETLPDRMLVINYSRMPFANNPDAVIPRKDGAAVLWQRWRLLENKALYNLADDPLQKRDVAAEHPEIVQKMRAHLDEWWQLVEPRVNEPQRVVIGDVAEMSSILTACEWWNVFVDQQAQVRRGELKNGVWHLDVAQAGHYAITLRRWPREATFALTAAAPAAKLTDGALPEGKSLDIAGASIEIAGQSRSQKLDGSATNNARFDVELPAGPTELKATFLDSAGRPLLGAYYVEIQPRLSTK